MNDSVPARTAVDTDSIALERAPELTPAERKRDNLVIGLLLVAAFTVILNETVMGVAIPHLMTDLDITAVAAQWLTTAFLLTMAVVIPVTGYLIQRFPTRSVFMAAMMLFSLGTLIAALAPGFPVLLAARVVQASGTAIMLPLLMTTVMTLVPAAERGRRMGNITIVIALAPALGPTISGTILSFANWRFLFWFVLPVALTVLAVGFVRMTNVGESRPGRIDGWSIPLAALGFGGVVFGLSRFGEEAATRDGTVILASLAVGAVALAVFVWRQLLLQRTDRALLDLRTFRSRAYTIAVLLFVIAMSALFGAIILLPLFMQGVLKLTVLSSGLLLLPGGLIFGLMGPVVGRLYDRRGRSPAGDARSAAGRSLDVGAGAAGLRVDALGRAARVPCGAQRRPLARVHSTVHREPGLAATTPVLPRVRDVDHHPAGGRRGGHRCARVDDVGRGRGRCGCRGDGDRGPRGRHRRRVRGCGSAGHTGHRAGAHGAERAARPGRRASVRALIHLGVSSQVLVDLCQVDPNPDLVMANKARYQLS